ncbi:hypothetical protein Val02_07790 [Virgisporangium aliadipatigenens]|uniref:Uncharacterized protein n=1 Tax=Virgisporangium aliadipatigenens TaxID=741659 RepID=A0A8J3YGP3_9ACTN|nr:hypothetical protein [Virgisporangium aliadipatigenens]GIJ43893.1 hypothetical protein Val02_07790 [Virgisporangium aliadipatigenens]
MATHTTRSYPVTALVLRGLLAVALVVPVGLLFGRTWGEEGDRIATADQERLGIEYLKTLGPLTIALTDAQSAAVAGREFKRETLTQAVAATAAVDARIGGSLHTHERWTSLREKIEGLLGGDTPDATTVYNNYGEAAELLLALYDQVRDRSHLIREQDADAYYLQDGASEELPEAIVAAGRFADLAVLTGKVRTDLPTATANLLTARDGVLSPVSDLAQDLQSAIEGTSSRTMSGNLLGRLDRFQRGVQSLTQSLSALDGRTPVDSSRVNPARVELQAAGVELAATILDELDGLIAQRGDDLSGSRLMALLLLLAGILLALVPLAALLVSGLRRPAARPAPAPRQAGPTAPSGPPGPPPAPTHGRPRDDDPYAALAALDGGARNAEREWSRAR